MYQSIIGPMVVPMVYSVGCKREAGTSRRAPRHCKRQGQHGVHP
jgi:hypothetical protein